MADPGAAWLGQLRQQLDPHVQRDVRAGGNKMRAFRLPAGVSCWLADRLRDSRDLPVAELYCNIVLCTLPSAALVFWQPSHLAGLLHLVVGYALLLERYLVALLHVTQHRQLFTAGLAGQLLHATQQAACQRCLHADCWLLNGAVPLVLAPFFGVPSGMYKLHHRVMHHRVWLVLLQLTAGCQHAAAQGGTVQEGNHAPGDITSTEPYQRDCMAHFLLCAATVGASQLYCWTLTPEQPACTRYWARHACAAWLEVPWYACRRRQWPLLGQCLATEGAYLLVAALLWRCNAVATLWVLVLPYLLSSLGLMFGNWCGS